LQAEVIIIVDVEQMRNLYLLFRKGDLGFFAFGVILYMVTHNALSILVSVIYLFLRNTKYPKEALPLYKNKAYQNINILNRSNLKIIKD